MIALPGAPGAPVVFLDIDDVLCLCERFGAHEALAAVKGERTDGDLVYRSVMHASAVAVLRDMHEEMGGAVRYVVSSSWRFLFTREQMCQVFRETGLGFVADCMEDEVRWSTPQFFPPNRHGEVAEWLADHHDGVPFVVIDDMLSGDSLTRPRARSMQDRSVFCAEDVGLSADLLDDLLKALRTPLRPHERWKRSED